MNTDQPPGLAKWLLRHLSSSPNLEAIVGDLDERYAQAPRRVWYWRQVAVAIIANMVAESRSHKVKALFTVFAGWLSLFPLNWLLQLFLLALIQSSPHSWYLLMPFIRPPITPILWFIFVGWIIGRLNRPRSMAMVLLSVVAMLPFIALRLAFILNFMPHLDLTSVLGLFASISVQVLCVLGGGLLSGRFDTQRRTLTRA